MQIVMSLIEGALLGCEHCFLFHYINMQIIDSHSHAVLYKQVRNLTTGNDYAGAMPIFIEKAQARHRLVKYQQAQW